MIKLYVDATIRLKHATRMLAQKTKNEDGFVSAETIALAVAGVLLVGVVFVAFQNQIGDMVDKLLGDFFNIGKDSTDTPAP